MVSRFESKRLLCVYLMLVIAVMLYMGLRDNIPKTNQVQYSASDKALVFGERALAYSKHTMSEKQTQGLNQTGFAINLAFSPRFFDKHHFQFLMLFSNGNPAEQLVIAQVRDYVIVMNGEDYNYRQKKPRISIKITDLEKDFQQLKLTVSPASTVLSLNGKNKVKKSGRLLAMPNSELGVRLLLSGSELLENNWHGAIKSLSVSPLATHINSAEIKLNASLAEGFDQGINSWLLIPKEVALLKHRLFYNESFNINSANILQDILLNFLGFVPFGFLVTALLFKIPMSFKRELSRSALLLFATFLCGFLLSFIIEYRQAWLITRNSSLRDLYLNALGGGLGTLVYLLYLQLLRISDRYNKR